MLTHTSRWSHARGNEVVPSRWQATFGRGVILGTIVGQGLPFVLLLILLTLTVGS
jgi:hypothetical protein